MIKYQIPYRAYDDVAWRIDISLEAYEGDPINVKGVSQQCCVIALASDDTDDPYAPIIKSTAALNLYNQGQIDILEMQNAEDRDFVVQVYRNAQAAINLFSASDPDVVLGSYISYVAGTPVVNASYNATGFIPVMFGQNYLITYKNQIAWYDATETFISGDASTGANVIITPPAGAVFLRASVNLANWDTFSVANTITGYLYWQGFLIPDGIQQTFQAPPYNLQINCTDGLSLLEKMPYNHNNLPGLTSDATRCPMNYIRNILFSTSNLNVKLPIHWTNTLQCTAFMDDMFTGQVSWSMRGEGFSSYQTLPDGTTSVTYKTCEYILAGILKSAQCNIKQTDGKWVIRRINDIVTGEFDSNSIAADLEIMTVVTETINVNKNIGTGGYPFLREDQIITVRKGVKSCKVTYEANVRENILPNGSQDFISSLFNLPFYWGVPTDDDATFASVPGIDGRGGYATDLTNVVGGTTDDSYFTTLSDIGSLTVDNALPIDAYTLIQRVSFGFIFSPVNGFPYDPSTGIIDFSSNPLTIQIVYQNNDNTYFLDEFAIWRPGLVTDIPIKVEGLKINDIVQVDFNRNNAIIIPKPTDPPEPGGMCELSVRFNLKEGQRYTVDYIYFTTDENNDVFEATAEGDNTALDERTLEISSSWGGYMLSNYMTYWANSDDECFFQDGSFYTGTLTGLTAQAIMRFLYKSSLIYNGSMEVRGSNWSFDEIYSIDTLTDKKFLPLSASYNTETAEVSLIAIECRNDDISLSEKHFGTNDQTLSN